MWITLLITQPGAYCVAVGKEGSWTFPGSSNRPQGKCVHSLDTYLSNTSYGPGSYCLEPIF